MCAWQKTSEIFIKRTKCMKFIQAPTHPHKPAIPSQLLGTPTFLMGLLGKTSPREEGGCRMALRAAPEPAPCQSTHPALNSS